MPPSSNHIRAPAGSSHLPTSRPAPKPSPRTCHTSVKAAQPAWLFFPAAQEENFGFFFVCVCANCQFRWSTLKGRRVSRCPRLRLWGPLSRFYYLLFFFFFFVWEQCVQRPTLLCTISDPPPPPPPPPATLLAIQLLCVHQTNRWSLNYTSK